jgi:hypothetical protein
MRLNSACLVLTTLTSKTVNVSAVSVNKKIPLIKVQTDEEHISNYIKIVAKENKIIKTIS